MFLYVPNVLGTERMAWRTQKERKKKRYY